MSFIHCCAIETAKFRLDDAALYELLTKSSDNAGMFAPLQPFGYQQGIRRIEDSVVGAVLRLCWYRREPAQAVRSPAPGVLSPYIGLFSLAARLSQYKDYNIRTEQGSATLYLPYHHFGAEMIIRELLIIVSDNKGSVLDLLAGCAVCGGGRFAKRLATQMKHTRKVGQRCLVRRALLLVPRTTFTLLRLAHIHNRPPGRRRFQ